MTAPTDSQCELIQRRVNSYLSNSRSPLQAFDAAKRELRSAIDVDWNLVSFDAQQNKVSTAAKPKRQEWASGTVFMLPGENPEAL